MWEVTPDILRFLEAEAWFRARLALTDPAYRSLQEAAQRRTFFVSGVAQADIIRDVFEAIDHAVAGELDFAAFREQLEEKLLGEWGDIANPGHRLETIYRQNVQTAYSAGRWAQQHDPEVLRARPYFEYDSVIDSRTSTICRELDGTLLPADDPFWETRWPPNHFLCRSAVKSLTKSEAERKGVTESPTGQEADTGFRRSPSLDDWTPDPESYPEGLRELVKQKLDL